MTLTDTATLTLSGPESNGNEELLQISQTPRLSLTIRCSLVSYPGYPVLFFSMQLTLSHHFLAPLR